jgi:phospholipid transport system substrate-binding protein
MRLRSVRAAAAAAMFVIATPAFAGSPVEAYVSQTIDQGLALLNNKTLSASEKDVELRNYLKTTLDIDRIALFTLGPAAKTASSADIAAYESAFETFTLANYVDRVGAYGGQSLKITGVEQHAPGDFIVSVEVVDPAAPANAPPDSARFRVLQASDGHFSVVDANVEGVWFELAQHDDIQGFLHQNGDSIPKLVEHLNAITASLTVPAH